MIKAAMWIFILQLCSCMNFSPPQENIFVYAGGIGTGYFQGGHNYIIVDNSPLGNRILQGFPIPEDFWEMEMDVATNYDEYNHTYSRAHLLFRSYRFADGCCLLVLIKQLSPSYTLISYKKGVFFPSYHTHIRFLVERSEEEKIPHYSREILGKWREKHRELAGQPEREYKDLLFFFTKPIEGRFYFLTQADGTVLHRDYSSRGILPANQIESLSEYGTPGEPRPSYHPSTYEALFHAIKVFTPVNRPAFSTRWEIEDHTSVIALAQVLAELLPRLSAYLSQNPQCSFTVPYSYVETAQKQAITEGDVSSFPNPYLGENFVLKRYQRRQSFSLVDNKLESDWIHFAAGEDEIYILFTLHLRKAKDR